ncbi:MAG: class I SAM-dependent methyltransferase [Microthrixaceae bacterium]
MSNDPSRYGHSFADVYDLWYGDRDVDSVARCMCRLLPEGGHVVELGVGTGLVAERLLEAGFTVTGIDASPPMLERARDRLGPDVDLIAADAAAFALEGDPVTADAVLGVFNLVFNLADASAQAAMFRAAADALGPGGLLVLEAFVPDLSDDAEEYGLSTRSVADDAVVLVATQRLDDQRVAGSHVELRDGSVRLRPWHLRLASPAQLDVMAAAAGFRLVERCADLDSSPYVDGESHRHVSVWSMPGV